MFYYQLVDSEEGKRIRPKTLNEAVLNSKDVYDDKRLIVHYMQPYAPFFSEQGERLISKPHKCPKQNCNFGNGKEALIHGYHRNLRYVLKHVEQLLSEIDGKTVITSDHGNLFFERMKPIPVKTYGHPAGVFVNNLLDIPWLEVEGENRREIASAQSIIKWQDSDSEEVESRLEALGYLPGDA